MQNVQRPEVESPIREKLASRADAKDGKRFYDDQQARMRAQVDPATFLSVYLTCPRPFQSPSTSPSSTLPLPQPPPLPTEPQSRLPQSPPQSSAPQSPRSQTTPPQSAPQSAPQSPRSRDVGHTPLPKRILDHLANEGMYHDGAWVGLPGNKSSGIMEKDLYNVVMNILEGITRTTRQYCPQSIPGRWFDTYGKSLQSWSKNTVQHLKPDFVFAHNESSDEEIFWSRTFSVMEFKREAVADSEVDSQLSNYVSHIFADQVDRLFVNAVAWRGWELQVYRFDRSGVVCMEERINIHKAPEDFIQVIASFSYLSPADLGWDPTCKVWDSASRAPRPSYEVSQNTFRECGVYDIPWVLQVDDESFVVLKAVNPRRWLSIWGRASFVVHAVTLADWASRNEKARVYILKQCWQRLPGLGPDPKTAELQNADGAGDQSNREELIKEFEDFEKKPFEAIVMERAQWMNRLRKSWMVNLDGRPVTTFGTIRKNYATSIPEPPLREKKGKRHAGPSTTGTRSMTGTPDDTGTSADTGTPADAGFVGPASRKKKGKRHGGASTTRARSATGTPADIGTPADTGAPADAGTPPVPGLITALRASGTSRKSTTSRSSAKSQIPRTMQNAPSHKALVTRTLVRLVFDRPGWPIERFTSKKELLKSLKVIVQELGTLYEKGVVHRDVSPSNLIISDFGGHMIDFDHSKMAFQKVEVKGNNRMDGEEPIAIATNMFGGDKDRAELYVYRLKKLWKIEDRPATPTDFNWPEEIGPVYAFGNRERQDGFLTGTYQYISYNLTQAPFHHGGHDVDSLFWCMNNLPLKYEGPGGKKRQNPPTNIIRKYYDGGPSEKTTLMLDFSSQGPQFSQMMANYSDYFKDLKDFMKRWYLFLHIVLQFQGYEYYHPHPFLIKIIDDAINGLGDDAEKGYTDEAEEERRRRKKDKEDLAEAISQQTTIGVLLKGRSSKMAEAENTAKPTVSARAADPPPRASTPLSVQIPTAESPETGRVVKKSKAN